MTKKEFTGDLGTGGRPKFGVQAPVKPSEPECEECGDKEGDHDQGSEPELWPDGKILKYYPTADEHSCFPCANGGEETGSIPFVAP